MEKLGLGLTATAFAALTAFMLISAIRGKPHLAEWPVVLACAVAFSGLILTASLLRQTMPWTRTILFLMLLSILTVELLFNPRCWVVLDPQQHGCHSTMIAIVLGAVGLALSRIKN
jgi:hypothetical protein